MTTTPHPIDGRVIAAERELAVLRWLDRFGTLSSSQLARLIWPDARQGVRMAQRTLGRLLRDRLVLRRSLRTGGCLYALGEGGARRLRDEGYPARFRGSRDVGWSQPYHRTLANDLAIDAIGKGQVVWTEREIQTRRAPFKEILSHVPDVLIQPQPDLDDNLVWIEVENTYKSQSRLIRLLDAADVLLSQPDGYWVEEYFVERLVFAVPNPRAARSVVRAVESQWSADRMQERTLDRLWLWPCHLTPGLRWYGVHDELPVKSLASA